MITPTSGMAGKFRRIDEKATRLKLQAMSGAAPAAAAADMAARSASLRGQRGRRRSRGGMKRMIVSVAA
jgi:hypothetical protein